MLDHIPVLLQPVLECMEPVLAGPLLDATLGLGGHSKALLSLADQKHFPTSLFGLDQDPAALVIAKERLDQFTGSHAISYIQGNFGDLALLATQQRLPKFSGILMDIGLSSLQLDDPERGFSFSVDGPLDMRMDPNNQVSAFTIVNTWPEEKLAMLLFNYGEERLARKIAKAIVHKRRKRQIATTNELAELLIEQYPLSLRHKRPHPATRTFQALRIEVNGELDALDAGIEAALELLMPHGRLAVISFHSLEDRTIKRAFREWQANSLGTILTKKPLEAGDAEIADNPRSRSAKLRVFERA